MFMLDLFYMIRNLHNICKIQIDLRLTKIERMLQGGRAFYMVSKIKRPLFTYLFPARLRGIVVRLLDCQHKG